MFLGRLLLLLLCAAGCAAQSPPRGSQTVRGVLLEVQSPGIQQLERFTLRTDAGREMVFVAAPDFNAGASHVMTPGHMRQHMALADPVVVTYRDENGTFVALSATDATN
ncbi:MAG: hypothetical protein M3069_33690 [Chloroflexota bacterium]|nr:hypothetical protein [Chloroflexota bacterium]